MATRVPLGMLGEPVSTPDDLADLALGVIPIGGGCDFYGADLPSDRWMWADGSAVSRTTYATLFARLGTAFGAGDGSTTFNLPDKRGRVSVARDNLGGAAANRLTLAVSGIDATVLGASGGDQRAPAHTHEITDPGHSHSVTPPAASDVTSSGQTATGTGGSETITTYSTASAPTGVTVNSAGEGTAQNVQPTLVCNYIIRVL